MQTNAKTSSGPDVSETASKVPFKTNTTNQIGNFGEINHGIDVIVAFNKCQSLLLTCKVAKQYAKIQGITLQNTVHYCSLMNCTSKPYSTLFCIHYQLNYQPNSQCA